MNSEMLTFILYFVALMGVALYFYIKDKQRSQEDFFLGGRQMGPWVAALSAQASDMSAWLLMGLPGSILAFGFGQIWIGIGLALGTALNWIFCARRLRVFSEEADDSITIPQFLANRFAADTKTLQIICALIFLFAYTIYVASAFVAGTTVFGTLFPSISTRTAMIVFAVLIVFYTLFGGFTAVCWTDFFQGMLMMFALMAVPIVVIATHQNLDTSLLSHVYEYTDANGAQVTCDFGAGLFSASWQDVATGFAWGLGYFGMPHIIVRFMSIEKPSQIKKSSVIAIVWVVISLGCACLIAYMGRMLVADELLPQGMQKVVFITMARKYFPPAASGLLLAAIIAASVSTADSQLLVASSSFTSDLYIPLFRKNASEKEAVIVGRIVVVVIAIIAFMIASSKGSGAQAIMNLVENAWGAFGASFGPVIILALFWREFNYKGAIAGIVAGFVVDLGWLFGGLSGSTGVYELLPGFIAGGLVAYFVAKATPTLDKERAVYDAARAADATAD
ncbi:MAG: sodium/proline symporter [Lachnospiraceae bacterium]|nr:sodium/proline symporter [Lachnospiraceae bacterium]